jgi:hypothetical protein
VTLTSLFIQYDEDLRYRISQMECKIEDDELFLHILINLTPDYDRQVATMEKRIGTQDADEVEDRRSLR